MTKVVKLGFFATPPHGCNYLPGREAVTLFADPRFPKNTRLYSALADCGFRRSGEHLYIPHCQNCSSCVPVRVPVAEFSPSRNQVRTLRRNRDLAVTRHDGNFSQEQFDLYRLYLKTRHKGGGMDDPTPDSFMDFLSASWTDTAFYEMRLDGALIAVAIADHMQDALSAVYTFYDPAHGARSLGRFAVLHEIEQARQLGKKWLYLGYRIEQCRKMRYKDEYQPLEYFVDNQWQRKPASQSDSTKSFA